MTLKRTGFALIALAIASACASCAGAAATDPAEDLTNAAAPFRNAVEPPGPLDQAQWGDDLLVVSDKTIPEDLVARIKAIEVAGKPGIAATEQFALGQFTIEGSVFDLAAVDPDSFRRFAGKDATTQGQWEAVAAGRIAVLESLRDRLPGGSTGPLAVGSGEQASDIQLGAYGTQTIGPIDGIVNTPWGEDLGLPADNALLISTGIAAPQAVRDRIEALAPHLSISSLDIAAQTGIDTTTVQNVHIVGTFADAVGDYSYTSIGGGRIAPDSQWVKDHIVTGTVPILGQVTCNKYLMPQLEAALTEVQTSGLADQIHTDEYAGCYYPRFIAGSTTLSNHAFGLALDLNVPGNQRGTPGEIDRRVVAIFKRWGFAWGGDWNYTDPMHFELDRIVNPG